MPRRILVVDDSPTMRSLHSYYLREAGFETVEADNGFTALEALGRGACDLALVDVNMPGMDGLTLTRCLRADERTVTLPVILCTTLVKEADRRAGVAAGANAYITKPPDAAALLATIERVLASDDWDAHSTDAAKIAGGPDV